MLEVVELTRSFGGLVAVDDASLTVEQGKIVSLIGPNGAGKTTLFALVGGFLKPDGGEVRFRGSPITGRTPHEICRLGLVRTFQIVQPFANLSVRENIAVGAYTRHRRRRDALDRAEMVAKRLGMAAQLDQPASALTVAALKRLELARALATEPTLMLLDEVMAGLNDSEIEEIVALVQAIRDDGVTIFLIEHVMRAVAKLSDHIYVLNNGAVIAQGSPEFIADDPAVVEAYLGRGASAQMSGGGGSRA